jgi:hypothetical protein
MIFLSGEIGSVNTQSAQFFLLPNYSYLNKYRRFEYSEDHGERMEFRSWTVQFDGCKKQNHKSQQTHYRTFKIKRLQFCEWWHYVAIIPILVFIIYQSVEIR